MTEWRRGFTAQSRKRGKLHLSVARDEDGDYRATCNLTILLRPDAYPQSRLETLPESEFCKACLEKTRLQVPEWQEVGWAEMKPDIYGGESCEEHVPRWDAYFDGDKQGTCDVHPLTLDPKNFPAGTKVVISTPMCPRCYETQETCHCGFDWKNWVENEYS
jgi:hypothetical protein